MSEQEDHTSPHEQTTEPPAVLSPAVTASAAKKNKNKKKKERQKAKKAAQKAQDAALDPDALNATETIKDSQSQDHELLSSVTQSSASPIEESPVPDVTSVKNEANELETDIPSASQDSAIVPPEPESVPQDQATSIIEAEIFETATPAVVNASPSEEAISEPSQAPEVPVTTEASVEEPVSTETSLFGTAGDDNLPWDQPAPVVEPVSVTNESSNVSESARGLENEGVSEQLPHSTIEPSTNESASADATPHPAPQQSTDDLFGSVTTSEAMPWDTAEEKASDPEALAQTEQLPLSDDQSVPHEIVEVPDAEQPTVKPLSEDAIESTLPEDDETSASKGSLLGNNEPETTSSATEEVSTDPFASTEPSAPLPWESSEPTSEPVVEPVAEPAVNDTLSRFAKLDLDDEPALDLTETAAARDEPPVSHEAAPQSESSDLFGASETNDFASMISQPDKTVEEAPVAKKADKFAFLALDDDLLEEELLEDEIAESSASPAQTQSAPSPAPIQQKYQPAQPQPIHGHGQFSSANQYHPQFGAPSNGFGPAPTTQQSQHHLDIAKLNQKKQKSDAYDFPMDFMPQKPIHRPAKAQSTAQLNQQYQASARAVTPPVGIPGRTVSQPPGSPAPPVLPPKNPYAPATNTAQSPLVGSQAAGAVPVPGGQPVPAVVSPAQNATSQPFRAPTAPTVPRYGPSSTTASGPPPTIKKKQSSFFEELPLPQIVPKKARAPASTASSSPVLNAPHAMGQPSAQQQRPSVPPTGSSRSPSISLGAPRSGSVVSAHSPLVPSPAFQSQVAPQAPVASQAPPNPYAPPAAQQAAPAQANIYAPPQQVRMPNQPVGNSFASPSLPTPGQPHASKYAPAAPSVGLGMGATPKGHLRQPSNPSASATIPVAQSPQPQLSHLIDSKNPYAQAVPLTGPVANTHPGAQGALPAINTSGNLVQPAAGSVLLSPSQPTVTPSSTKYAPINHRRQASTSATQYDPYSAHKLNQKRVEEEQARFGAPPQPSFAAPPVKQAAQSSYAPSSVYAPASAQTYQQGYVSQQLGAPQQSDPEQLMRRQFPLFSWGSGSKVAYFIPPSAYGGSQGIQVVKTTEVLVDEALKDFQNVSRKNTASAERFLDNQIQKVVNRFDSRSSGDELLILQLLKHKLAKDPTPFNLGGDVNYRESVPASFNEHVNRLPRAPISKRHLVSLISSGQKEEALNLAVSNDEMALALLISSIISKESWFEMVDKFLCREFKGDEDHLLPLLFRILTGDVESVMQIFATDTQKRTWALSHWKSIAAAVITNEPACLLKFLSLFGQLLLDSGAFIPGYILFMIADAPLSAFQATDSVMLTLYLEIYGLYLQGKNHPVDLSTLHLQLAYYFSDYDMPAEAQKYLDAANTSFKTFKRADPRFVSCAKFLSERLSGATVDAGWFAKPKLDRVWGTLDKGLNKFISGDEIQSDSKDGALFSRFSPSISRSSSYVSVSGANTSVNPEFQSFARPLGPSHRGSSYDPGNSAAPGAAPAYPVSAAASARGTSLNSFGGSHQGYAPAQHPSNKSVTSSPAPTGVNASPLPKSKYAPSAAEPQVRRPSAQFHTGGYDHQNGNDHSTSHSGSPHMNMPLPVFNGSSDQLNMKPSSTSSASAVGLKDPASAPAVNQIVTPNASSTSSAPAKSGTPPKPPAKAPLPSAGPPKTGAPPMAGAPPKVAGPPRAGPPKNGAPRSGRATPSFGIDDLLTQDKPKPKASQVQKPVSLPQDASVESLVSETFSAPTPAANTDSSPAAPVASASEINQPATTEVAESSAVAESALSQDQSAAHDIVDYVPPVADAGINHLTGDHTVGATVDSNAEAVSETVDEVVSPSSPETLQEDLATGTDTHGVQFGGESEASQSQDAPNLEDGDFEGSTFDPETPHNGDQSQTQSEMGSVNASPYVVPDRGSDESVTEEHDVPQDLQDKVWESREHSKQTPAAVNPYAPIAHPSPSVPSINGGPRSSKKSSAAGRFTPKSYTPSTESSPVVPTIDENVDFYSMGGYQAGYQASGPTAPQADSAPSKSTSEIEQPKRQSITDSSAISPVQSPVTPSYQPPKLSQPSGSVHNPYEPKTSSYVPPQNAYAPSPQKSYVPSSQNTYSPQKGNFGPYQPGTAGDSSSRNSSFGASQYVVSPEESKFAPLPSGTAGSSVSGYEPPSMKKTAYEPPKVHTITSIAENDETYDDFVEDEDSDDEDGASNAVAQKPVKEDKKPEQQKQKQKDTGGSGWFGWLKKGDDKGPTVHRAKLGEESSFVYDEKLKRWVNKNAAPEENEAIAKPPPPPIIKKKPSTIGKPRSGSVSDSLSPVSGGPVSATPSLSSASGGPPRPAGGPPKPSLANASDLDSLLSAGGSTRRKKKGGRGYVNVMNTMTEKK